jgi:nicotinamidase/pyrazinamidase
MSAVDLVQIRDEYHPSNLGDKASDSTWTSILTGDLRTARDFYHAGFGSPYLTQDARYLFAAAGTAALATPALFASVVKNLAWSLKDRFSGASESSQLNNKSIAKFATAQKYIGAGLGLGALKTVAGVAHDVFKFSKWMGRLVYSQIHPEYKRQAIVLIDLQDDFFEGGPLAVTGASKALDAANRILLAKGKDTPVIASQDWHPGVPELPEDPEKHGSFASQHGVAPFTWVTLNGIKQMAWPDHCVQGTKGAEVKKLAVNPDVIVQKGQDPRVDSYSAFYDNNHTRQTKMNAHLKALQIDTIVMGGLATDYCVGYSAKDALQEGYNVIVITDAIAAIDQKDGYSQTKQMLEEVAHKTGKNIQFCTASEWISKEADRNKMPGFLA